MPTPENLPRRAFLTTMARIDSAVAEPPETESPEDPPFVQSYDQAPCHVTLAEPAIAYLRRRYGGAVRRALREGFFGGLTDREFKSISKLPPDIAYTVEWNSLDWLIAEGVLELKTGLAAVIDLLVEPGGAKLDGEELDWIDALGRELLSLYEIVDVTEEGYVHLRDALTPGAATRIVPDGDAAAFLAPGDIVGLRLVHWERGRWFSGSFYKLGNDAVDLLRGLRAASYRAQGDERRVFELVLSQQIVRLWLKSVVTTRTVAGGALWA